MKSVNLHLLTRTHNPETMSLLLGAMSGSRKSRGISPHEAASLCALTDLLTKELLLQLPEGSGSPLSFLDGFYFSYVIEHIGKEFDLLKISSDSECVLNIELKSEEIGEERIKKQLEQNRYYLGHIAHTILSYTYVMETGTIYRLSSHGYLKTATAAELTLALRRPALQNYLPRDIGRLFRASDYLISPVASPDKFLQGQYFLTNQQFDFRRRILAHLREQEAAVVCIKGVAGTGKTLLLFDLAMQLSVRSAVMVIHAGPLRKGHLTLDERLKNVSIRSGSGFARPEDLTGFSCLLIDEADHLSEPLLALLLSRAKALRIPVILTYDPHHLLREDEPQLPPSDTPALIEEACTLSLAFTGNIRINRPVYSFLRTLLNLKDHPGEPDFECIDVLYARDTQELSLMTDYYRSLGYELIAASRTEETIPSVIAQEYDKVLLVLDRDYYYDEEGRLKDRQGSDLRMQILYEALSRTRENLCLIAAENPSLFSQVLSVRLGLSRSASV